MLALPDFSGAFPPATSVLVVVAVLAYSLGAHLPLGPGALTILAPAAALQAETGFADFPNVEIAFITLAPWWAGQEVRRRRLLVRELDQRTRELETEEAAFARLSMRRERARIACELHDVVSHHLAVMVIHAGAGRLAAPAELEKACERLRSLGGTLSAGPDRDGGWSLRARLPLTPG